jgi:ABA DEFICIENT 4-like
VNMSASELFSLANQTAMVGWAILVFLPRRWPPLFWIPQFIIPGALAFGYATLALVYFSGGDGGFGSIADVRSLFAQDEILLAGWIHYLAFDLFVGAWIARRSDEAGIPRLIQAVFLGFTFMYGPAGFLLFLITRALILRSKETAQ